MLTSLPNSPADIDIFPEVVRSVVNFGRRENTFFFHRIKHQLPYRCIFLRSHWRDTSTTKLKPAVTCVKASSARSLLLPLKWRTPTGGVILLVQKDFCLKTKNLTSPKVISSTDTGGKERKEKCCLYHFGLALKLKTSYSGLHEVPAESNLQLQNFPFPYQVFSCYYEPTLAKL